MCKIGLKCVDGCCDSVFFIDDDECCFVFFLGGVVLLSKCVGNKIDFFPVRVLNKFCYFAPCAFAGEEARNKNCHTKSFQGEVLNVSFSLIFSSSRLSGAHSEKMSVTSGWSTTESKTNRRIAHSSSFSFSRVRAKPELEKMMR